MSESAPAMLYVAGQRFTCSCSVNVFTTIGDLKYRCNGCGDIYEGVAS